MERPKAACTALPDWLDLDLGVRPGDELMGLTNAILTLGTRTLIASVTPVDDADTCTMMQKLHLALASGYAPAAALSEASQNTGISGFVCFGYGG